VIDFAGNPQCQRRLADSTDTKQRDQARLSEETSTALHLFSASNET
jgi:hypothetical protein